MRRFGLAVLALLSLPAFAVSGDGLAKVYASDEVKAQIAQLVPGAVSAGSSGSTMAGFGNLVLKLSVRTRSGWAEIHAHQDDLMLIEQGTATLVSGGSVVGGKSVSEGEIVGTSIEGGHEQTLKPGDVVVVPAGVPHQLLIPEGTTYAALVAKVKE